MPTYTLQTDSPRPHVPAGDYEGTFIAYTLEKDKPDFEGDGVHDEWRLTADFGEVEDVTGAVVHLELPWWVTVPKDGATVHPKSKLWKTHLAVGFSEAEPVDLDAMMERPFIGVIDDKDRAGPPPSTISKLADIRASRPVRQRVNGGGAKAKAQPVAAAVADEGNGWD